MSKKISVLTLIFVLLFALSGCGKSKNQEVVSDSNEVVDEIKETEVVKTAKDIDFDEMALGAYNAACFGNSEFTDISVADYNRFSERNLFKASEPIKSNKEIGEYISEFKKTNSEVLHYVILIDPIVAFDSAKTEFPDYGIEEALEESLYNAFEAEITNNTSVDFSFLISSPSADWWAGSGAAKLTEAKMAYSTVMNYLTKFENASVMFLGSEDWVVCNGANYQADKITFGDDMSLFVLGELAFNKCFRVDATSFGEALRKAWEIAEAGSVKSEESLASKKIIMFGDSVIGRYRESTGIAKATEYFTGAEVINCAVGGHESADMRGMVELLLYGENEDFEVAKQNSPDYAQESLDNLYSIHNEIENYNSEDIIFVFNCGLNDYFGGVEVGAYYTNLSICINSLRAALPDARMVVINISNIEIYSGGYELPEGGHYPLIEYRLMVERLAEDIEDVEYVKISDIKDISVADAQGNYRGDGVHPWEGARFEIAKRLAEVLCGGK